jgi:hypothetical protein
MDRISQVAELSKSENQMSLQLLEISFLAGEGIGLITKERGQVTPGPLHATTIHNLEQLKGYFIGIKNMVMKLAPLCNNSNLPSFRKMVQIIEEEDHNLVSACENYTDSHFYGDDFSRDIHAVLFGIEAHLMAIEHECAAAVGINIRNRPFQNSVNDISRIITSRHI